MFNNILVLCTANICRSPAAEAVLRAKIGGAKTIVSAGVKGPAGRELDPSMQELLLDKGISIANHESKKVTPEMLSQADLILGMETTHLREVAKIYPPALGKAKLLGHWNGKREVPDPYRKAPEAYHYAAQLIEEFTQSWKEVLLK